MTVIICYAKKKKTTAAISTSKVEDQAMSAAVHEAL